VGQLVEVLAVAVEKADPDGPLLGASVDGPRVGRRVAARAVEIGGWALGATAKVEEVEAVLDGEVVARAPVRHPRPDIAAAFPDVPGASSAGFELALDASRGSAEAELEVRARVGSDAVPIGRLRLRRGWRGEPASGEPALVSAILLWEDGEQDLERTLRGVVEQASEPIELLVVHPAELDEAALGAWTRERGVRRAAAARSGGAALRDEGVRRSNGQFLLFLEAGTVLAAGGLGRGLELLRRHPEAAGLLDAAAGGPAAAAIYRRAAFEELGGFEDGPERRAAAYGALLEPGALVAADGS
jgi:hypothetical protein